ncbi:MAG: hypothetical protein AB9834_19390 [Lentimicrobium sp.]
MKKTFNGEVILEIPFSRKISSFEIAKPGAYSIWHKGQVFRKAPLNRYKPVIRNEKTDEVIDLIPSFFRPNSNNGRTGRMELFRFSAPSGKFRLELTEGSSVTLFEQAISGLFPLKKVDVENYFIQVRKSQPFYYVLIGIPLISLAGFLIIGGLVFGILAG